MTDGHAPCQASNDVFRAEIISHQAQRSVGVKMNAIKTHDPGRFLATMLQGMQSQRGVSGGIFVSENTKNAAFFVEVIVIGGVEGVGFDHGVRST